MKRFTVCEGLLKALKKSNLPPGLLLHMRYGKCQSNTYGSTPTSDDAQIEMLDAKHIGQRMLTDDRISTLLGIRTVNMDDGFLTAFELEI